MESKWKGESVSDDVVSIQGAKLKKVSEYKYLWSVVQEDGALDKEVTSNLLNSSTFLCFIGYLSWPV